MIIYTIFMTGSKTPMQTFTVSIPLAEKKLFGYDVSDGQSA